MACTYMYIHVICSCILQIFIIISGYAVAQWLGIRLQMLGVAMVTGVSFIAVLEHHFNTVDPGVPCMASDHSCPILTLKIFC